MSDVVYVDLSARGGGLPAFRLNSRVMHILHQVIKRRLPLTLKRPGLLPKEKTWGREGPSYRPTYLSRLVVDIVKRIFCFRD